MISIILRKLPLLVAALLLLPFAAFSESTVSESGDYWRKHAGSAMGTSITMEFWCEDNEKAKRLIQGVMNEMRRIDQLMSPYIESSELAILNAKAADSPVPVSKELFDLLGWALKHGQWSKGVFDITYASVGHQYDYRKGIGPEEETLKSQLALIDFRAVQLDDKKRTVFFQYPGLRIDLGGIAKGHAVDRAAKYLLENGISNGMVSAGGDSRLIGDRRGRPWMLGIKNPRGDGHIIALPLDNVSISTSGDYERYFIDQSGERHHHIINPKSGRSASQVRSVTILGVNATMTDALSTTVFVMGVKQGLAYINSIDNTSAIIIDSQGKLHYSNDLVMPERKGL